jgi:hypothetical protein
MKKIFKLKANAKHRNRPRMMSAVRGASIVGRTTDVKINTCCTNLTEELGGLKAQRTLAPASAR